MYDLTVIGGGIAGLGIAQSASEKGLKVLIIEKSVFADKTSNNSLRIIHGGFRYLQSFDLVRVVSSRLAQDRLVNQYPDLIKPLSCVMPLAPSGLKSKYPAKVAVLLYNSINAIFSNSRLPKCRVLEANKLDTEFALGSSGVLNWWDATIKDPMALAKRIVSEAKTNSAEFQEDSQVSRADFFDDYVEVEYANSEGAKTISSRFLVNAAGPWVETVREGLNVADAYSTKFPQHSWCKGFNVVLSRTFDPNLALGFQSSKGTLYFLCPREGGSALGTGYTTHAGSPQNTDITEEQIDKFISDANNAQPGLDIKLSDVKEIESGILPVRSFGAQGPVFFGSEHIKRYGRYIEVLSIKYTTFQNIGRTVCKLVSSS